MIITYSEFGCSCRHSMETKHDNLQAMTTIGAFEKAWLQQIRGLCRWQVDPSVCQAVTVIGK